MASLGKQGVSKMKASDKAAAKEAAAKARAARSAWTQSTIATAKTCADELEEWAQAFPDAAGASEVGAAVRVLRTSALPKLKLNLPTEADEPKDEA